MLANAELAQDYSILNQQYQQLVSALLEAVGLQGGATLATVENRNFLVRQTDNIRQQDIALFQCIYNFPLVPGADGAALHDIKLATIKTAEVTLLSDRHLKGYTLQTNALQQCVNQLLVLLIQY